MSIIKLIIFALAIIVFSPINNLADAAGNAQSGSRLFSRQCASCHMVDTGRHLTGPSLAGILSRKAATVSDFHRYSPALKSSKIKWNVKTLDAWLANPDKFIPDNWMKFKGIQDSQARADLIAYLKVAKQSGKSQPSKIINLKALNPDEQVMAIRYCADTYYVTTAGGTILFWEFNLRFKTDSSKDGPSKGSPALLHSNMMGDRAFVIFTEPSEISSFINSKC